MKRKVLSAVVALGLVALVVGCGGKYSDVVEVNQAYVKLMKAYVDEMAGVDSAAKAAETINKLADGMEKLVPKMNALKKKYPELKDPGKLPEKVKLSSDEVEAIGQKFGASFMKLMTYMADKKVQEAQVRLSTIMSGMAKE